MSGKRVDLSQTLTDEPLGNQRTRNDGIDFPEKSDLDISGHISSSKASQKSLVRWEVDPYPCSLDDEESCYPVPPSPRTIHGNPSRLSAPPPRDFCPLPASGIIPISAYAQSPPASHFTIPKDQQPAPVAPTIDLALDQPWGIISEPCQQTFLLHDFGNADGEDDPLGYQSEQAVPIGSDLSPKPTFVGFIGSVMDALVLFEGCLNGTKTAVSRSARKDELPDLIRSGNVFVYQDNSSEIHQWRDGLSWHRVLQPYNHNKFTIYRESVEQAGCGETKKGGLVKRVLKVKHRGIQHSLVSYCMEDMENKLPRPFERLRITPRDGLISDGGGKSAVMKRVSTPSYKEPQKREWKTPSEKRSVCQYIEDNPTCRRTDIAAMFGISTR